MPNWCDTTYKAVGTKKQVKKFYDLAMRAWKDAGTEENPKTEGWLGSFVEYLGGDAKEVYCRGWMQDAPVLSKDGEECTIYCNTAWGEPYEWRTFIEEHIDGLFLYYVAVEPGCQVFCSNDDAYADKYYVDNWNDGTYTMTEEETVDYVNKYFNQDFDTIDECIDFAAEHRDENGDADLWINAFEVE